MSDSSRPGRSSRSVGSGNVALDATGDSENAHLAAVFGSPIGSGFSAQLASARQLTPPYGLRKAARVAVAASMLLAGRGPGATS